MELSVLAFITSFVMVFLFTPSLLTIAKLKNLHDEPLEDRKLHKRKIPTIGGIVIFAACIFSFCLWYPYSKYLQLVSLTAAVSDLKFVIAAVIILFFVGLKDDIIGTAPIKKLLAQLTVSMLLVLMADIKIKSFHGLLGVTEIPEWASVFISVFAIIVIINAFNLIDGVDGLAAGIGLIVSLVLGFWFYLSGNIALPTLAFSLAGCLAAFLFYNFSPARIFMGDSGSLTIGVIIAILVIKLVEYDSSKMPFPLGEASKPLLALSILVYPLYDTLRVFIVRTLKGLSPFSADRNHIHHRLLDIGFSHKKVSILLYAVTIFVIALTFCLYSLTPTASIIIVAISTIVIFQIPFLIKTKNGKKTID